MEGSPFFEYKCQMFIVPVSPMTFKRAIKRRSPKGTPFCF